VRYGDLGGDGVVEAIVPVWRSNGGGTASGVLGQVLVVFTVVRDRPAVLGIVTTSPRDAHRTANFDNRPPYFDNSRTRIEPGGITVEEAWYAARDATCCPTGRVEQTWEFTGATLVPGAAG
jgi:hypothetical protein